MIDEHDESLDREVDLLADAADGEAIDAGQRRVPPSFAAVLARAHRIDPGSVDETALERAADPPVRASTPDPEQLLQTLVLAARAEAEASATQREARPAPALRRPRRRTALVLGALAATSAVAAAAALALSLRADALDLDDGRDSASLASARAERDDAGGIAVDGEREPTATRPRRARPDRRPASPSMAAPEPQPEPELEPEPAQLEVEPQLEARPQAKPRPARSARTRLQELDDRARAALATGDLQRADDLLDKLIQRGGRHRLVEAAFGDRFAIAHRLHSASAQRGLWRAYLERFPDGRFADDARAGLCRRATRDTGSCWSAYLDDFPRGAYRAQAERALGDDGP